ncbi:uncharacterized protein LOC132299131 [Cornus florida]|uniref:uncharacterized protein LOC132299131 n=1 Tax=Cornus florida TaxID=4283 RepID=UPI0028A192F0|nr:uncharacterized protein LOC132299131 [Cornus florida]
MMVIVKGNWSLSQSTTFPSSVARKRLVFLEEQVWNNPPSAEDLISSSNLKELASSASSADLMDLLFPSFDNFPFTDEEKKRAEALKKKAVEGEPLVVIHSTEQEKEVEELPLKKKLKLNPSSTTKNKGITFSKSRGKKTDEADPEEEVRAFVLAEKQENHGGPLSLGLTSQFFIMGTQ